MKAQIAFSLLLFLPAAFAAQVKTQKPCLQEHTELNELKHLLEQFKKDCNQYPSQLLELIEKPASCMTWGGLNGPYLKDRPETRDMVASFDYELTEKGYEIVSRKCPSAR